MSSSKNDSKLDLERDLPTTEADVLALRRAQATLWRADLRRLNSLDAGRYFKNAPPRTEVFPDQPEFVL